MIQTKEHTDAFVKHFQNNLPDVSERPAIPVDKVRFWMMSDDHQCRPRKKKKRYPKPHSLLQGLKGIDCNHSIDFTIGHNKWCVTFRDEKETFVDLVYECMVCFWLCYISRLVCSCHYYYLVSPRQLDIQPLLFTERTSVGKRKLLSVTTEVHSGEP